MKWTDHISTICGKANKTLGFLRRNLNISSVNAYKSLVRPLVEYASSVWDPYQQMIQRRAARCVRNKFGNRSSVDMRQQMNWRSLEHRRQDARLI